MATPFPFGSGNVLTAAQMNAITTLPINDQTASYVALVGDVGKRIVMNVASGNTVTINNSVFAAGDTIFIANKGAGSTTVTAGAGVTINTASSLVLAQHGGGTLVALSASVFTFFSQQSATYGTATGGTSSSITVSGVNYTLLTFTSSSTLTVTKSGLFDVLLFAGGGGGAYNTASAGGGGAGGGGAFLGTVYISANTAVAVGAKGLGATSMWQGAKGSRSYFGTTFANYLGVWADGGGNGDRSGGPGTGGCGGGGGDTGNAGAASTQIFGGNAGANCVASQGGGGGGVGGAGGFQNGGSGYDVSTFIGGSTLYKGAGAGGSGSTTAGTSTALGQVAGVTSGAGNAAATNSAGGGSSAYNGNGGNGGDGIVYVRFKV